MMLLLLLCLRHLARYVALSHTHTFSYRSKAPVEPSVLGFIFYNFFQPFSFFLTPYITHTLGQYKRPLCTFIQLLHPCNGHGWQWRHARKSDRQPVLISTTRRAVMASCNNVTVQHQCNKSGGESIQVNHDWITEIHIFHFFPIFIGIQ